MSGRTSGALERLERVLVMVPWLLEHPGATYEEIAERFDVEADEVAADLDVLGYCGLPGYGGGDLIEVATMGNAVTVRMADYFTRPLRLNLREAVTMLLAVRSLADVEGLAGTTALLSAKERLEALVGAGAPMDAEDIRVAVDLTSEGDEHLPVLREAIASRAVVHMTYRSASKRETTVRDVEPWWLVAARGSWYVHGWCRLAQAPRDFRLDRVAALEPLDQRAPHRPGRGERPEPDYQPSSEDTEAVVRIRRPSWWFTERIVTDDVAEDGEWRIVRLHTASLDWLARELVILGEDARVDRPEELRHLVEHRVRELLGLYGGPVPDADEAAEALGG